MAGTEQGPHLRPPFPKPPWYLDRPGTGRNPGQTPWYLCRTGVPRGTRQGTSLELAAFRGPNKSCTPIWAPNWGADRRPGLAFVFEPTWGGRSPARAGFFFRAQLGWQIAGPGWFFVSGPNGVADRRPGLAFISGPKWCGRSLARAGFFFCWDPNGVSRPDGRHVQTNIEFQFYGPTSCGRIDRNSKWLLFSDPNGGARGGVDPGWLLFSDPNGVAGHRKRKCVCTRKVL